MLHEFTDMGAVHSRLDRLRLYRRASEWQEPEDGKRQVVDLATLSTDDDMTVCGVARA